MEPTIKRIRLSTPYAVHPDTGQIYSFYEVVVKWPDGKRETFDSEEHAQASIEKRAFNADNLEAETPEGVIEAVQAGLPKITPDTDNKIEEVRDSFDVFLIAIGKSKVSIIKVIREFTGLGLKECKAFVDSVPCVVRKDTPKDIADEMKFRLLEAGATVELQ